MAKIISNVSRTFSEYLIVPGLTNKESLSSNISLKAPVKKFAKGDVSKLELNIPITSACMQAVSGPELAIGLARQGGMSFIFCSQPIESQAAMIERVKSHKAGFVQSDSNLKPTDILRDFVKLQRETDHSTMPITENGASNGKFLGIITDKDFWEYEDNLDSPVSKYMTPKENVIYGKVGISLTEANSLLHKHKKQCLPILDEEERLSYLVFTKDYVDHRTYPNELLDCHKRLMVAGGITTHDYKERLPVLIDAGVDVVCFDSSDGYSEFQKHAALWVREKYGEELILGGGNIVSGEAFLYLIEEAKLDFVKVGIGGGSICITREQKGIGRGQASALMDVVAARDKYYKETGVYVPVCSDG